VLGPRSVCASGDRLLAVLPHLDEQAETVAFTVLRRPATVDSEDWRDVHQQEVERYHSPAPEIACEPDVTVFLSWPEPRYEVEAEL
jgi:hypothetical protein